MNPPGTSRLERLNRSLQVRDQSRKSAPMNGARMGGADSGWRPRFIATKEGRLSERGLNEGPSAPDAESRHGQFREKASQERVLSPSAEQ
jgi:hypothetical protein